MQQSIWVNLFDVGERQGRLIDGASTALHLSRTQLSYAKNPFSSTSFDLTKFLHVDTGGGNGPQLVSDSLCHPNNIRFVISETASEITVERRHGSDGNPKEKEKVNLQSYSTNLPNKTCSFLKRCMTTNRNSWTLTALRSARLYNSGLPVESLWTW